MCKLNTVIQQGHYVSVKLAFAIWMQSIQYNTVSILCSLMSVQNGTLTE